MKTKPEKEQRRFGSFWVCPNCEGHPEFEHKKAMEHMQKVHDIGKGEKGTRSMLMHVDGDTWFSWKYEWEIKGLKFLQTTCTKRVGDDAEMWR